MIALHSRTFLSLSFYCQIGMVAPYTQALDVIVATSESENEDVQFNRLELLTYLTEKEQGYDQALKAVHAAIKNENLRNHALDLFAALISKGRGSDDVPAILGYFLQEGMQDEFSVLINLWYEHNQEQCSEWLKKNGYTSEEDIN